MRWPRYISFIPAAMVVIGAVFNMLSPRYYWGDYLLGAAVVVAGGLLSRRHTIAVAAAIVLVQLVLLIKDGYFGHAVGTLSLISAVFTALVGLGVNRVVASHSRRLQVVRSVAEAVQRAVLPAPPARVGPLAIAAVYKAAQIEALIGGDAYAVQETPYGTRLLIADVRGKGLDAVGTVAVLLGTFREAADQAADLVVLAERMEHALIREAASREESVRMEGFVTAVLGEITSDAASVRLLNCGHPSPYLLQGDTVSCLDPEEPSLPLGMSRLGVPRARPDRWPFPAGSTLLLVTDGVTEARSRGGTFYDPASRLGGRGPFRRPEEVIEVLVRDVERWAGGPRDDDMAILAITRRAGEPAP
ncbi:PP2C family protein-serine/threonine phosphatase [Nonomuraea jabiensis]|uniref:Serine phosphatase RsbU (Regulator of sigma subunit) n=1 Tax=Nonomuraea jabiensis TaxID=882448 RepID=A0A7W9GCY7_9ACTN|nr:PP2C family protein-serine/threonine phosphatase [Nonomuraea jabiensis]MBB5781500.1 serine phosphatase RsbU (regulator of sigma subunit) [Nonomuraea jabiensis]